MGTVQKVIKNRKLNEKNVIIIPVNRAGHWSLLVIENLKKFFDFQNPEPVNSSSTRVLRARKPKVAEPPFVKIYKLDSLEKYNINISKKSKDYTVLVNLIDDISTF